MRVHYLQHIELEYPGIILQWAQEQGHSLTHTRFYNQEPLPAVEELDWLIIMGGPMNIYEEEQYPWLSAEKELIRQAIEAGKVVLGICLGSQLIADVIGGKVTANPQPEIGWFPVRWNAEAQEHPLFGVFPGEAEVFHWHYDTFSVLPPEAQVLAASDGCARQAYVYRDRVIGLQFHLENTVEMLHGYIAQGGGEMKRSLYVQTPEEVTDRLGHVEHNQQMMRNFLTRLEQLQTEGEL